MKEKKEMNKKKFFFCFTFNVRNSDTMRTFHVAMVVAVVDFVPVAVTDVHSVLD